MASISSSRTATSITTITPLTASIHKNTVCKLLEIKILRKITRTIDQRTSTTPLHTFCKITIKGIPYQRISFTSFARMPTIVMMSTTSSTQYGCLTSSLPSSIFLYATSPTSYNISTRRTEIFRSISTSTIRRISTSSHTLLPSFVMTAILAITF